MGAVKYLERKVGDAVDSAKEHVVGGAYTIKDTVLSEVGTKGLLTAFYTSITAIDANIAIQELPKGDYLAGGFAVGTGLVMGYGTVHWARKTLPAVRQAWQRRSIRAQLQAGEETVTTQTAEQKVQMPEVIAQPMKTEMLPTTITTKWTDDWGKKEAMRELMQNIMDEYVAGNATQIGVEEKNGDLYIYNVGKAANPADLIFLGEGTKREEKDMGGVFGSGTKKAAAVFVRLGIPIEILTGTFRITPQITKDSITGTEAIAYKIDEFDKQVFDGVCCIIKGEGGEAENAKRIIVGLSHKDTVVKLPATGSSRLFDRMMVENGGAKLYIRGIEFTDLHSSSSLYKGHFSYDLNGELPGGRDLMTGEDRIAPEWQNVLTGVGRLIAVVQDVNTAELMLSYAIKDERSLEHEADFDAADMKLVNKKIWVEAAEKLAGGPCYMLSSLINAKDAKYGISSRKPLYFNNPEWTKFLHNAGLRFDYEVAQNVSEEVQRTTVPFDELPDNVKKTFKAVQKVFADHGIDLKPANEQNGNGTSHLDPVLRLVARASSGVSPHIYKAMRSLVSGNQINVEFVTEIKQEDKDAIDTEGMALQPDTILIRLDEDTEKFQHMYSVALHEVVHLVSGLFDGNPNFGAELTWNFEKQMPEAAAKMYALKRKKLPPKRTA